MPQAERRELVEIAPRKEAHGARIGAVMQASTLQ